MNELSLVIQSVCLEAAVGIMLFLAIGRLLNKELDGKLAGIVAAVLAVVGVASSITHLGQPLRAFNSLLHLGSSWMSNETLLVALFTACCVLYVAANLWMPKAKVILEWVSALCGLVLLYAMGSIYTFTSVPVWQGANTYVEYYATAIILGAALCFALTQKQQSARSAKIYGGAAIAALVVQLIFSELHAVELAAGGSMAPAASAAILSANGALIAAKWVLFLAGAAIVLVGATRSAKVLQTAGGPSESATTSAANPLIWAAPCAVFAAAFIGKVLFFSSMVVSSIGM